MRRSSRLRFAVKYDEGGSVMAGCWCLLCLSDCVNGCAGLTSGTDSGLGGVRFSTEGGAMSAEAMGATFSFPALRKAVDEGRAQAEQRRVMRK